MMDKITFIDAFDNINLSKELKTEFKNTIVNKMAFGRNSKKLEVEILSTRTVDTLKIDKLQIELKKEFDFIDDVVVTVDYNRDEREFADKEAIDRYWPRLLNNIKKFSPVCYIGVKDCKYTIVEGTFIVYMHRTIDFYITKKNLREFIEQDILNNLNMTINVDMRTTSEDTTTSHISRISTSVKEEFREKAHDVENNNHSVTSSKKCTPSNKNFEPKRKTFKLSQMIQGNKISLSSEFIVGSIVIVEGDIVNIDIRELKSKDFLVMIDISDDVAAVTAKLFCNKESLTSLKNELNLKERIILKGKVENDDYSEEINIKVSELACVDKVIIRCDEEVEKRIELHLHTKMSSLDSVLSVEDAILRAKHFGHKSLAITDSGVVQAYPEAMEISARHNVKIIYGLQAYIIDDINAVIDYSGSYDIDFTFVVFDIETTGLNKYQDKIIEIGAVKLIKGEVVDTFSRFINPEIDIPEFITNLTGINNSMVKDASLYNDVLPEFINFIGDAVLVAHNVGFDIGFIARYSNLIGLDICNSALDTVEFARAVFPKLSKHKLDVLCKHLNINLENHHRAIDDAKATAMVFLKMMEIVKEEGIRTLLDINLYAMHRLPKNKLRSNKAIILVKNKQGLNNLYELVSKSHIDYYFKAPRIPKSEFLRLREGLLICPCFVEDGELFKAISNYRSQQLIDYIVGFYDYLELQPLCNFANRLSDGFIGFKDNLIDISNRVILLGEQHNKLVVAAGDVHFLEPEDSIYRDVFIRVEAKKNVKQEKSLYFKTTKEMLSEFDYISTDKAKEIVVTNTNLINDMIESVKPIPDGTYPPQIQGSDEEISYIAINKAKEIYGDKLPDVVIKRLDQELSSIVNHGFSVMYIIAQKLVSKSMEDGYLVGSRGSIGSSFVATMAGITEVNPLSAHYFCKECKYSDFDSDTVKAMSGSSGYDLPDKNCPICNTSLCKEGHEIPFETFLGFEGDKEPDIDLNFSGEYQNKAHAYAEELFGADNVFRAGTIATIAEKTAYGYVKKYAQELDLKYSKAYINKLKLGCMGVKRTTGQHPGGLMILPKGLNIFEFCPIQRPANDMKSDVVTTHFDYHSISGRLLKLDILGHDVPTILKFLHDSTGIDPLKIDLGDKNIISLFTSPQALGLTEGEINCKTGTLGLPEFGTSFVRQMLLETRPSSFSELIRISGLSHGTNVWFNNAQELISKKLATLKDVIPTRDDIMVYLINKGLDKQAAFKIMEQVRKGKGLTDEDEDKLRRASVPDWYINSCNKISYMFPKGHAVAYVMMTVRIGYYKIYEPYSFYAALFYVKIEEFDYEKMCKGQQIVQRLIDDMLKLGKNISVKDKSTLLLLEIVFEMYARGLKFAKLDIYKADELKFVITEEGIMPPLCSIAGLGLNVADNIVKARQDGEFYSILDFKNRSKANVTVIELLKNNGVLNLPETEQLSFL